MFDALTRPLAFGAAASGEYEETNENFVKRVGGACCTSCSGLIMFIISFAVLGWNEFNYVDNVKIIDKVRNQAVDVGCTPSASATTKLIFASCPLSRVHDFTGEFAQSPWGGLLKDKPQGVWYKSSAKILQWEEDKKCQTEKDKVGGGTTTRCQYSFKQVWSDHVIDSASFHCQSPQQSGCYFPSFLGVAGPEAVRNTGIIPNSLRFNWTAPFGDVAIGANRSTGDYMLNDDLIGQIKTLTSVALKPDAMDLASKLTALPGKTAALMGDTLQFSSNSKTQSTGDLRVNLVRAEYSTVGQSFISVMAKQDSVSGGVGLSKWYSGMSGTMSTVNWLFEGHMGIDEFMGRIRSMNEAKLNMFRVIGFFLMWLGLCLFTSPLAVIPDIVPCVGPMIGDFVGMVLAYINFGIALGLSLLTIAITWLAARPLYGLIALVLSTIIFGSVFMLCCRCRRSAEEKMEAKPIMGRPVVQAEYA